MENDDMPDKQLQNYLRKAYATNAKDMNKSLRGSSEAYVPMVIPMNIGGMNYLAHPIGAGESGAGFLDTLKNIASVPLQMALGPVLAVKKMIGGKCKKSCKKTCKVCKGGVQPVENLYELPPPVAPVVSAAHLVVPGTPHSAVNGQLHQTSVSQGPVTWEVPNGHLEAQNGISYAMPLLGELGGKDRAKKGKKGGSLMSAIGSVANMFGLPKTPLEEIAGPELTNKFKEIGFDFIGKHLGLGKAKPKKVAKKVASEPKKVNPWLAHVKAEKAKYPSKSFKEVLQLAKLTYKK